MRVGGTDSVLVEVVLKLLHVAGLGQAEHEEDARLLGVQLHAGDEPELVVVDLDVAVDDAGGSARAAHDGHALLGGAFERSDAGVRRISVTDTGDQKTTRTSWICDAVPGGTVKSQVRQLRGSDVVAETLTTLTAYLVVQKK